MDTRREPANCSRRKRTPERKSSEKSHASADCGEDGVSVEPLEHSNHPPRCCIPSPAHPPCAAAPRAVRSLFLCCCSTELSPLQRRRERRVTVNDSGTRLQRRERLLTLWKGVCADSTFLPGWQSRRVDGQVFRAVIGLVSWLRFFWASHRDCLRRTTHTHPHPPTERRQRAECR